MVRAPASAVIAVSLAASLQAAARPVAFRADDGVPLVGTFYEPVPRPGPAVILVHMLTRSREDWQAVGARLAEAGIGALALDLRGHGASGPALAASTGQSDLASQMLLDVAAARSFLRGRPDLVFAERIGLAGASVGANLVVTAAAGDPAVRSIALLSAGLEYRGLRVEAAMKKYGTRPALLVASRDDPYATRSLEHLATAANGVPETRLFDSGGHGTVMLTRQPDLIRLLVDWFRRTLL